MRYLEFYNVFAVKDGLRKEILELYQENGIEMIRGEQKQ